MNPLRLRCCNYRTFELVELDLPAGVVAVIGANGAGKSSLVNAIDLALFGPDGRSWAPYLTHGGDGSDLELELAFEHADKRYQVRRRYSSSGKTTLDLEREITSEPRPDGATRLWAPETRESQAATQELLEQILGLDRETFRASSFLVQGDGAAFTEAKPADRKRLLANVLGLGRYERLLELVKADRKALELELAQNQGRLAGVEEELGRLDEVERKRKVAAEIIDAATRDLGEAEQALEIAASSAHKIEQARQELVALRGRWETARATEAPLVQAAEDAAAAEAALSVARAELETLPTAAQIQALEASEVDLAGVVEGQRQAIIRRQELERKRNAAIQIRADLEAKANELADRANELTAQAAATAAGRLKTCPTCEQELDQAARTAASAALEARAGAIEDELVALEARLGEIGEIPELPPEPERQAWPEFELGNVREQLERVREQNVQRGRLEERIRLLQETIGKRPSPEELDAAKEAAAGALETLRRATAEAPPEGELDEVRAAALTHRARVEEERIRLDAAKADHARAIGELERLAALDAASMEARDRQAVIHREIDELAILQRAYSRDGIPALIIQNAAIPSIEVEAGRILAELGTSYRVELRTERANADGTVADALDVIVYTETGERPYETFSGGERTRLNLALRIALARLLAGRRGAESRLLAIDEPEFLDQAGTTALAGVLRTLTSDFDRIYLISHVPELRDSLETCLEVVKGPDGRSAVAA